MAWPFAGSWEGLTVQALAEIIPAIVRAINERRECIGDEPVEFTINGVTAEYFTAEDLDGLDLHDPDMMDVIDALEDEIKVLVPQAYTSIAATTLWSNATSGTNSLLEDMGLGNWTGGDCKVQDLTVWDRMREALERLVYFKVDPQIAIVSRDIYRTDKESEMPPGYSAQDMWDTLAHYATDTTFLFDMTTEVSSGTAGDNFDYLAYTNYQATYDMTPFSGVIIHSKVDAVADRVAYGAVIQVTIIGPSGSASFQHSGSGYDTEVFSDVADILDMNGINDVTVKLDPIPTSVPFDGPPYTGRSTLGIGVESAAIDVSGELTDQAA